MSLATDLQSIVSSALTEFGQSISVTRDNIGSYAVATGTVTDSSDTTYTGVGYPSQYRADQIDGTLIQQTDTRLVFYSATAPVIDDIFTIGSKVMTAQNVQTITEAGTSVCYIVQLRQ